MNRRRVLVTGAGGMIGAAVVARLNAAGVVVSAHVGPRGFDDSHLPETVDRFWCDVLELGPHLSDVAAVVHLAGPPGVAASFSEPERYVRDHTMGTAGVIAGLGTAHLVYVSSAEVYGRVTESPVAETAPTVPVSPYGAAKLGAEALVRAARPDSTIIRPFSVYGPRSPGYSLVHTIMRQARSASVIELASLSPVRDYVHVDDVTRAIAQAVGRAPAGTFNIGSGQGTSVAELASLVCRVLRRQLPVRQTRSDRPVDLSELVADVSEARTGLGWTPTIGLAEGIAAMASQMPNEPESR
jgi:nucleoside-diphosphate-sugar epimerase